MALGAGSAATMVGPGVSAAGSSTARLDMLATPPKKAAQPPRIVGRMAGRWFWMLATVTVSVVKAADVAAARFWSFFQNIGVGIDSRAFSSSKNSMAVRRCGV